MFFPFLVPVLGFLELSLVFYPLVVALILLSILCLPADLNASYERNRPNRSTGKPLLSVFFNVLIFGLVLYHFGIDVSSWKLWLPALAGYLVLGTLWATGKWWVFCGRIRDKVKEVVDRFSHTVEDDDDPDEVGRSFMSYLFGNSTLRQYGDAPYMHDAVRVMKREDVIAVFVPMVAKHKTVVLTWLFCWPMSILKWALADMLRDLYNGVFAAIKGFFQKIAAKRFENI